MYEQAKQLRPRLAGAAGDHQPPQDPAWLQSPTFSALTGERDPVVGTRDRANGARADDAFTIPTCDAPVRLRGMPEFVRTLGGGYFFLPSRSLLTYYLAS